MGANVYPVSLAAERAWDAAHGKDIHYMVGKEAHRARLMQRLLPRFLHNQMKKARYRRALVGVAPFCGYGRLRQVEFLRCGLGLTQTCQARRAIGDRPLRCRPPWPERLTL